jgi:hypothetical protein
MPIHLFFAADLVNIEAGLAVAPFDRFLDPGPSPPGPYRTGTATETSGLRLVKGMSNCAR